MKKTIKIAALLAVLAGAISLTSCKKDEPTVVNFTNATAEYVESFLGKSVDDFKKACEESGMIQTISEEGKIRYGNTINNFNAEVLFKNNIINQINYSLEKRSIDDEKKKMNEYLDYLTNKNYAGFKGETYTDIYGKGKICFKNINEYKNSINGDTENALAYFIKTSNGASIYLYSGEGQNGIDINFTNPDGVNYTEYKSEAMSSCN